MLLAAFKAGGELAENALAILGDPERQFVSSDFVRLELLPKPICYGNDSERLFYETFFTSVEQLVRASSPLVEAAEREAEAVGLSAMDALHIAAAKHAACDDFVTAGMRHPDAESALTAWYKAARQARWESLHDVQAVLPFTDQVECCLVFNVCGNKYRLICRVSYANPWTNGTLWVKHFLTHAEYDKQKWKKDCLKGRAQP